MTMVWTTKGQVKRDDLAMSVIVEELENCQKISVEWRLAGELVRRDVWVNMFMGVEVGTKEGKV